MSSIDDPHDTPLQERFVGMFSYGSNNENQLRARLDSPRLRGRPAFLEGYVRVFGFNSSRWGGSVASVAPKEGGRVYGRFYCLTPQEVEILDMYEGVKLGGYTKEPVMVSVRVANENESGGVGTTTTTTTAAAKHKDFAVPAITYVMSERLVKTFVLPSPQYLTACYRTQTSSFPELANQPIEICDHTGSKRSEWIYPGIRALPLEAFLLEVGLREKRPWTFPTVLEPLVAQLHATGVTTTDALCEAATSGTLLWKLAAAEAATGSAAEETNGGASGGGSSPPPMPEGMGEDERAAWVEFTRIVESRATVPAFTNHTLDIIARIVCGQIV